MSDASTEAGPALALATGIIVHLLKRGLMTKAEALQVVQEGIRPAEAVGGIPAGDVLREFANAIEQNAPD